MINIVNKKAKRLYVAEFDRQMTILENIFIRELRPILNRQYLNSAAFVAQGILDIGPAINVSTDRLIRLLAKHYKRVATTFSNKTFKIIESSKNICVPEIKTPKDEFWKDMNLFISTQAGEKIQKINKSTRNNITAVIQRGMNDGISHIDIAKNIRKNGLITNRNRAITISRTETHTAAVKAVDASIKSTRIEMEREWVSAKDLRTRTMGKGSAFEHFISYPYGPDGERVSQDGYFQKTGEPMKYPGDPSGSAANVIRCRCCLIYHTVKRTEELKPYEPEVDPEKNISYFESTISNDKKETAAIFDPAGKLLFKKTGDKSSVTFNEEEIKKMKGNILTHNHPLSTSFSFDDVKISTFAGMKSIRAIANKEKILYKLTLKDPDKYYKNLKRQIEITEKWNEIDRKIFKKISKQIENEELTIKEANLLHHHEVMEIFSNTYKTDYIYDRIELK